jgi:hypothetical protein
LKPKLVDTGHFGVEVKKTAYKVLKQNTTKYQTLTNLASSDVDACVEAGRLLVADLYDPKGSAKSVHRDLNKLMVKLTLSKDSSLVKLPPSEAAFRQHILRVAFQVGICFRCRLDNYRRFPNFQLPTIGVTADFYILHFLDNRTINFVGVLSSNMRPL